MVSDLQFKICSTTYQNIAVLCAFVLFMCVYNNCEWKELGNDTMITLKLEYVW